MDKETLEEAAERLVPEAGCELNNSEALYWQQGWISGHIDGAKWQSERMYSEEEVLKLLIKFSDDRTFLKKYVAIQWFEQNKKK